MSSASLFGFGVEWVKTFDPEFVQCNVLWCVEDGDHTDKPKWSAVGQQKRDRYNRATSDVEIGCKPRLVKAVLGDYTVDEVRKFGIG